MDVTIQPGTLSGAIPAVASKSMAHRLLILAALAEGPCELVCATTSEDIEATRRCLAALGGAGAEGDSPQLARCARHWGQSPSTPARQRGLSHFGEQSEPKGTVPFGGPTPGEPKGTVPFGGRPTPLDVGESGSTLRFLLPVLGALGCSARIERHGRLAQRPLAPLDEQLSAHGMTLADDGSALVVGGRLSGGRFVLPGDVSSQYVSGLLMAAPLLTEPSQVYVTMPVQSRPYLSLTLHALARFGVAVDVEQVTCQGRRLERFSVEPGPLVAPARLEVEGDWSNAAFWLAAGALERVGLTVTGLDLTSPQGDRAILAALAAFGARIARQGHAARATADAPRAASLDVSAIPDLVPPLAAVAATMPGTSVLGNAGRLRLKESDRLATVSAAVCALGGRARVEADSLVIEGVEQLTGGVVDAANDHRIAMMAAVMATHAAGPVTVRGAECVAKSYPAFWDDYERLGGCLSR